jgi:hypothetical protein
MVETQKEIEIKTFCTALNAVLDELDYPQKENGRIAKFHEEVVKPIWNHSYETARKWVTGQSMPQPSKIAPLSNKLNCIANFLITNKGYMFAGNVKPSLNIADEKGVYNTISAIPIKQWATIEEPVNSKTQKENIIADGMLSDLAFGIFYDKETKDWKDPYLLIFDPKAEAGTYEYYCAKHASQSEPTLYHSFSEAGVVYLQSANVSLKTSPIPIDEFEMYIPMIGREVP